MGQSGARQSVSLLLDSTLGLRLRPEHDDELALTGLSVRSLTGPSQSSLGTALLRLHVGNKLPCMSVLLSEAGEGVLPVLPPPSKE